MSKIDKTDIENIKLITKEAKLTNLSRLNILFCIAMEFSKNLLHCLLKIELQIHWL